MSVEAAMKLAHRGLHVFPVDPTSKAPKTVHGCLDATRDERRILSMWRACPSAGIGVATGKPSGIVAIDVDPRSGGEDGFAELAGKLGNPGLTVRVLTPSGGYHLWYRAPAAAVACSAGRLAPGVDVRGDGGYVVAPPSVRPDGTGWRWAPGGAPLAELEGEWIDAMRAPAAHERPLATPVASWVALVRDGAPEGGRNHALARIVGHLLAKGVDPHLVAELAHLVNGRNRPPLPGAEVDQVVVSIASREVRRRKASR